MLSVKFKGKKKHLFDEAQDLGEFKGIPQKDLAPGETFEEEENGKVVTRKIVSQKELEGCLIVGTVIVSGA